MIYFLRSGDLVKIGHTIRLDRRMADLRHDLPCPSDSELLAIMDGGRDREQELHAQFAMVRALGEWFFFSGALRGYISQRASPLPAAMAASWRSITRGQDGKGWTVAERSLEIMRLDGRRAQPSKECRRAQMNLKFTHDFKAKVHSWARERNIPLTVLVERAILAYCDAS